MSQDEKPVGPAAASTPAPVPAAAVAATTPAAPAAPATEAGPPRWTKLVNWIFFGVAIAALAWMIRSVGPRKVADLVKSIGGGWFAVLMLLELGSYACDAAAIKAFMRPESRMIDYLRVFAAQLSGAAINLLMPTGKVGEASKVTLLVRRAPRGRVVSSVLLYNLYGFFLNVGVVVIGIPITALFYHLPKKLEVAIWLAAGILLALALFLLWLVTRGIGSSMVGFLRTVHVISPERRERWRARLVKLDGQLKPTGPEASHGTGAGIGWMLLSRLVGWIQAAIVIYLVVGDLDVMFLIATLSAGLVIAWVAAIVPMGIGVSEGGSYLIYEALGATATAGLGVALIRRVRQVIIAVLGLALMLILQALDRAPPPIRKANPEY